MQDGDKVFKRVKPGREFSNTTAEASLKADICLLRAWLLKQLQSLLPQLTSYSLTLSASLSRSISWNFSAYICMKVCIHNIHMCEHTSTHTYTYTKTYPHYILYAITTILYLVGSSIMARKLALSVGFCILLNVGIKYHSVSRAGYNLLVVCAW